MRKYFLAKTRIGQEYLFSMDSAMFCAEKHRIYLMNLLNEKRYNLKNENEKWHLYENDFFYNDRIFKEIKVTKTRVFVREI